MRKWSLIPRKTIHPHPSHQPPENFEETEAKPLEKPRTMQTKNNEHTEPHIVQQTNSNKTPFRMLKSSSSMKMALIKTNLKTKISTANQQQPTARTGQRN